jgi:hypothetical protein
MNTQTKNNSYSHRPPVFVVGPPRSGTTLTAKILGRHSNIFMPGETHFFEDIYSCRKELGTLDSEDSKNKVLNKFFSIYSRYNEPADQLRVDTLLFHKKLATVLASKSSYKSMFTAFMELQMASEGKIRWGNNTPRDLFNVAAIKSFYPSAKIIACIRDSRDYLLSYKNKWTATVEDNIERIKQMYHPIITSLLWKFSARKIQALEADLPKSGFCILKYESLVANPNSTVKSLCDFLEEDFEPAMLNIDYSNSSHGSSPSGIFSQSVGKWKSSLPNEETYITQIICKPEMIYFGYPIEGISCSYLNMLKVLSSMPRAAQLVFRNTKPMRGNLFNYLRRRLLT